MVAAENKRKEAVGCTLYLNLYIVIVVYKQIMRPMRIEVDERNASDVAELVVSKAREKLREKVALRSRVMIA